MKRHLVLIRWKGDSVSRQDLATVDDISLQKLHDTRRMFVTVRVFPGSERKKAEPPIVADGFSHRKDKDVVLRLIGCEQGQAAKNQGGANSLTLIIRVDQAEA